MTASTRVATRVRAASFLYALPGIGFAISVPLVLAYDALRGELPMTPNRIDP